MQEGATTSDRLSTPMALFDICSVDDNRGGTGTSAGNPPLLPRTTPRAASPESPPLPAGERHVPSLHCSAPPGNEDPGTAVCDAFSGVEEAFSSVVNLGGDLPRRSSNH